MNLFKMKAGMIRIVLKEQIRGVSLFLNGLIDFSVFSPKPLSCL